MLEDNHYFDEVHDCQAVFRLMLRAIANPGEIVNLQKHLYPYEENHKVLTTLALTLLDKETTFSITGDDKLAETIAQLTYAQRAPQEQAKFIFALDQCSEEEISGIFKAADPGTLVEPHKNCVLLVEVANFEASPTCSLTGPGVKDSRSIGLTQYGKAWVNQRDRMAYEYPTGIDLYFVTPEGDLMALPRKVKMKG